MRKRRSLLVLGSIILVMVFTLGGCPVDDPNTFEEEPSNLTGITGGPETGRAWGMHSWVEVTISVQNGKITQADVTGHETEGVGQPVIEMAGAQILQKNSVEIDVIASASITSKAIIEAGQQAIDKIIANNSGG
jgi:iron complex transport system substrate-binding protein